MYNNYFDPINNLESLTYKRLLKRVMSYIHINIKQKCKQFTVGIITSYH